MAVNNTAYQIVSSNLGFEIFLKKREHQKKFSLEQEIGSSLHTLCWGFKKIPFTLYTYVLAKILQNGAKFIQKLAPGFKNHTRNLRNFRQAVESPKRRILRGYFCPKIHFFS